MPTVTTPGQIIVNDKLPAKYRDYSRPLYGNDLTKLLTQIGRDDQDLYRDVTAKLMKLGANTAYERGYTITFNDVLPPAVRGKIMKEIDAGETAIRSKRMPKPEERKALAALYQEKHEQLVDAVFNEAVAGNNQMALAVMTKARGDKRQVAAMLGSPGPFTDSHGAVIPVYPRRGYSEGLKPWEFYAAAFGARRGVISTKFCLAAGTKVLMADYSERAIEHVSVGDTVFSVNERGEKVKTMVTAVFDNGKRDCYRYTFAKGRQRHDELSIDCTTDHKLFLRHTKYDKTSVVKLLPADRATKGRYSIECAGAPENTSGKDEPLALLLGYLLGDGGISQHNVSYYSTDQRTAEILRSNLAAHGLLLVHTGIRESGCSHFFVTETGAGAGNANYQGNRVISRLTELGLMGLTAAEKHIPAEVFSWSTASCAELCSALLETDGSVTHVQGGKYPVISFYVTSLALAVGLKRVLEHKLGIACGRVTHRKTKGEAYSFRTPTGIRKGQRNHDLFGFTISTRQALLRLQKCWVDTGIKSDKLKQLVLPCTYELVYGNRFRRKESLGRLNTYDIEVGHPSHMFVLANGAIVSNSTREAGYLGKQFTAAAEGLIVTEDDCGTLDGIPTKVTDGDNVGALLAKNTGPFEMGTPVDGKVLKALQENGFNNILVRSPITCKAKDGICKRCAGLQENGKLPELRSAIGTKASSSMAERIAQGALNVKHCLTRSTPVLYADWSVKAMEEVQVGDMIMGCSLDGVMRPVKVLNVFDNGPRECWRTSFIKNGCNLRTAERICMESTLDHKLRGTRLVTGQKDESLNGIPRILPVGTKSRQFFALTPEHFDDTGTVGYKRIQQEFIGVLPTMDLEVDHPDHLFVLANGLVVSNSGGQKSQAGGKGNVEEEIVEPTYAGFDVINQLSQVPETFRHSATVATGDGVVDKIEELPQGGWNVLVGGVAHYVESDQKVKVKPGDMIESGDQLSTGIINPAEVVRYKGIGEGRRYFAERLTQAFRDSNLTVNRRNAEIIARAAVDHVVSDDEQGDILPGDTVTYETMAHNYIPRQGAVTDKPDKLLGSYLEQPAMHHTIGSRVTKRMVKELKDFGIDSITTFKEPPTFTPEMVGVRAVPHYQKDWMAKLHSSYLMGNLLQDVQRGATTDIHGTHPVPAAAYAMEFGKSKPDKVTY